MDWRITKFPELSAESIKAISDWIQKNYEEREQARDDTYTYGPQAAFGSTSAVYLYSKALATIDRLDKALNLLLTSETIFTLDSKNYSMAYNQYIAEVPNLKSFKKTGFGTSSNDTLSLDSKWADNTIRLLAGDDTVSVSDGGHRVFANLGSGNDFFQGNSGSDGVFGEIGDDKILGGDGFDDLDGGGGNDVISGELGLDLIYGGLGDDILSGGAGDDFIDGGEGNDTATYQGNFSNYQITFDNDLLKIIDLTLDRDGSDTLTRIEYIKFNDITKTVIQLPGAPPTYTLTPSATTINEGAVLTSSVTTTNVATGTKLYYALSGIGIATTDFSAGALTGEGITDATGKFTFTHTLANDLTTEGAETLSINLYSDAARTLQVGATAEISIVDTSITSASFNLDVDGDGKVTALGDGLMVIRKLFGAAFAGDALTNKAMSPTSTRTTAEIHEFIQQGITTGLLDVDKDGKTTALGDGLMVIRHLFGAAFANEALTNKAISPASPYFGPPINHAAVAANIDALKIF